MAPKDNFRESLSEFIVGRLERRIQDQTIGELKQWLLSVCSVLLNITRNLTLIKDTPNLWDNLLVKDALESSRRLFMELDPILEGIDANEIKQCQMLYEQPDGTMAEGNQHPNDRLG